MSYDEYKNEYGVVSEDESPDRESGEVDQDIALHRGLKSRHITMIAIGGALGTGLIIGTGEALAQSGCVSLQSMSQSPLLTSRKAPDQSLSVTPSLA